MFEQIQFILGDSFINRVNIFPIIITLVVFLIATLTDMKKREVPDTLNYVYLGSGIFYALILSLYHLKGFIILNSLIGIAVAYGLGSLLYYMGQWGGGDAKLLMGFGAWHGFFFENISLNFNQLLLLQFIGVMFIAGGIYSIFYLIYLSVKSRKKFFEIKQEKKLSKTNIVMLIFSFMLLFTSLFLPNPLNISAIILALTLSLMYLLLKNQKMIESVLFIKHIEISKLTEGDWLVGDVKIGEKTVVKKTGDGLSKEDLTLLKKYSDLGKIKTVQVKEGIPFVPAFLIGYIILLLI